MCCGAPRHPSGASLLSVKSSTFHSEITTRPLVVKEWIIFKYYSIIYEAPFSGSTTIASAKELHSSTHKTPFFNVQPTTTSQRGKCYVCVQGVILSTISLGNRICNPEKLRSNLKYSPTLLDTTFMCYEFNNFINVVSWFSFVLT